jgi:hypothetical protein
MSLEDIMISEISQAQKDKYCIFSLISGSKISCFHRNREKNSGYQRLGREKIGWREFGD